MLRLRGRYAAAQHQRAAGYRNLITGQRHAYLVEGRIAQQRITALGANLAPPAPTANRCALLVDREHRIEKRQAHHLLASAKEAVERRVADPRGIVEHPLKRNG